MSWLHRMGVTPAVRRGTQRQTPSPTAPTPSPTPRPTATTQATAATAPPTTTATDAPPKAAGPEGQQQGAAVHGGDGTYRVLHDRPARAPRPRSAMPTPRCAVRHDPEQDTRVVCHCRALRDRCARRLLIARRWDAALDHPLPLGHPQVRRRPRRRRRERLHRVRQHHAFSMAGPLRVGLDARGGSLRRQVYLSRPSRTPSSTAASAGAAQQQQQQRRRRWRRGGRLEGADDVPPAAASSARQGRGARAAAPQMRLGGERALPARADAARTLRGSRVRRGVTRGIRLSDV